MPSLESLKKLRQVITENLRVQRSGADPITYIDVSHALDDITARQNHVVFGRRGCGKTLLLQTGESSVGPDRRTIYLNCEDFKNHSFPNVLIEILNAVFSEMHNRLTGWFGRKRRLRELIADVRSELKAMQQADDLREENIVERDTGRTSTTIEGGVTNKGSISAGASAGSKSVGAQIHAGSKLSTDFSLSGKYTNDRAREIERAYQRADSKIDALNKLLPTLKTKLRTFFEISSKVKVLFLQIDDFYHLEREHQPFVMDYVHRLCKDLPLYFKVATLRHASVLYAERNTQPVGAQERHDYQPIDIDFTFTNFPKTERQVLEIFHEFARLAEITPSDFDSLFKGGGFRRLVLAGGGVPRDCLSLFLETLEPVMADNSRIGKDDVRLLSFSNFQRKIEDLKSDSQAGEQDVLLKGIYVIRTFCLESRSSVFFVPDLLLKGVETARELIFRLLDYRIIHSVGTAFTHKSFPGSFQGFMVDIGCYAHMRKLAGKMTEIDLSSVSAKEQMRSVPVLWRELLERLWSDAPKQVTTADLIDQELELN